MKIRPHGNRLLIRMKPIEEMMSEGGIIIPEKHHGEWSRIATILAGGDKVDTERYKTGDTILVDWTSGVVISDVRTYRDDTLRMIVPEDILAWVDEE